MKRPKWDADREAHLEDESWVIVMTELELGKRHLCREHTQKIPEHSPQYTESFFKAEEDTHFHAARRICESF